MLGLLGVNVKSKIQRAKNALYTSDKAIQEIIFITSVVIEMHILKEMKESSHFALMLAESTDCTVTEQMVLHGRVMEPATGKLRTHFLKAIDALQPEVDTLSSGVPDVEACVSLCAQTITNRVCEYTTFAGLDMAKMRGIGTDGAATMVGHHRGVVTRLKAITPSAIGVHCAAHRLNLASTQAGDKVPYIKKFSSVLRQLYDFFENSSVRTTGLEAVQTLLGEESKKLLAPCSTRWLSIERSVNRLKTCFISVVISLQREGEERSDARAVGLYNLVTEYRFVCTILLLCDALPHVSHLSKCFQIADCDYSIIPRMVTSTVQAIQQLKRIDGVNMKGLKAYLEQIENAGIDITTHSNLGDDYFQKSIKAPYLDKLVSNIEARFDDKSIMASFDIFNPAKLPHLSDPPSIEELEHFADYGNNSVKTLVDQFQDIVADCFECLEEWSSFRQFLKENCNEMKHRDIVSRLCCDSTWAAIYPNITTFAKICRVVPIHTADVERTFSQLKLIKTSRRNRMNEKTLDSLLRIATEGPPVKDFQVTEAVKLWASKKNRRLSC